MNTWSKHYSDSPETLRRELSYAQSELQELKEQREREREREDQEREDRRRERQQEMRERERIAASWEDAFRKNRALYQRELRQEQQFVAEVAANPQPDQGLPLPDTTFWVEALSEVDVAERIWRETTHEYAPQLLALHQQIKELETQVRMAIVERFRTAVEKPHTGFDEAMQANDPGAWLNW